MDAGKSGVNKKRNLKEVYFAKGNKVNETVASHGHAYDEEARVRMLKERIYERFGVLSGTGEKPIKSYKTLR